MQRDALEETRWALEYVNLHGVSHLISGRRIPEIAFSEGRVSMDDGVNLAEGTYSLIGQRLVMAIEPTTALRYPAEALPEHDLFEHLSAAESAVVHGDFLHIRFGEPDASGEEEPDSHGDELVYRWEEDDEPA